jgi:hypothetical protein
LVDTDTVEGKEGVGTLPILDPEKGGGGGGGGGGIFEVDILVGAGAGGRDVSIGNVVLLWLLISSNCKTELDRGGELPIVTNPPAGGSPVESPLLLCCLNLCSNSAASALIGLSE